MLKKILITFVILVPGLIFGYYGRTTEMGLAIVAGSIAASFLNLDKIKRFKGAGFEAEMQKVVEEAYATIDNLKELGEPLILTTLEILTKEGRWGGMDAYQKHELKQELEEISKSLNLDNNRLNKSNDKFYRYHLWDHYQVFLSYASQDSNINNEMNKKLSSLKEDYSSKNYPKEKSIKEIINSVNQLEEKTQEALKDYLFYLNNKTIRTKQALSRKR